MTIRATTTLISLVALLSACGGGGGGSGGQTASPAPSPAPTPAPTGACSLRNRQDWAAAQLREWYLFPETLPASLDPSPYPTVEAYIDALTATARAQHRDRYFTYLTSIAEEDAYYNSGSTAGLGVRLGIDPAQRIYATEAFEGGPALAAGIDRGTEIVAIGTSAGTLRTVSSIIAAEGTQGVVDALGPDTAGTTRVLRITNAGGTRNVTVAKADFELMPVSSRYGARIINDGGQQVGYVNLRTFISTADPALRTAFASFRSAGITRVVVDLRYNGGGLISIAETLSDLLGGNRGPADVVDHITFRPEKAVNNTTRLFQPQAESASPMRIAFIGTGGTASASELVINAFTPYLHANSALIGSNTYGKPVGQIAVDRAECDDRFRIIALAVENGAHQGTYFDGLAPTMEATCQANDDIGHPLGDPQEASVRAALDFVEGGSCTPITGALSAQAAGRGGKRTLLIPDRPSTAQRETPGLF